MDRFADIVRRQREYFQSGRTLPISFRISRLRRLREAVLDRRSELETALEKDLRRSGFETFLAETLLILSGLRDTLGNLSRWAAPKRVRPSILNFLSCDRVIPEPYGVSLIISPWNYPFLLSLAPLAAAVSAGNCAIIKPSEFSPAASGVLAEITESVFSEEHVTVIRGDGETAAALLKHRFDKIFFTGSARVGKLVLEAAARHLTPTTLELGGKNPCIVAESADLRIAARRIVWGKMLNAGQTCIAPDYILAHRSVKDALIERLIDTVTAFYGRDIRNNPEFPRIVNERNHSRLVSYLETGKTIWGGEHDSQDLYFGPAILDAVAWEDPVMREEIFGPVLPVLAYDSLDAALEQISGHEKPLALYLFTRDKAQIGRVWSGCGFGGGCVNDTVSHFINERLPFGGMGGSGMGRYHGQWGFDAFSHRKTLVRRAVCPDFSLRYPPHAGKDWLKNLLLRFFGR